MANTTPTRPAKVKGATDTRKRAGRQLSCEIDRHLMQSLDMASAFTSMTKTAIIEWALEDWMEHYIPKPGTDPSEAITKLALQRVQRDKRAKAALGRMARTARAKHDDHQINAESASGASTQNAAVQHE